MLSKEVSAVAAALLTVVAGHVTGMFGVINDAGGPTAVASVIGSLTALIHYALTRKR